METKTVDEPRVEIGTKRIRAYLAGQVVADTLHPRLVWEKPWYPTYYFPRTDVDRSLLVPSDDTATSELLGPAEVFDVRVDEQVAAGAARRYPSAPVADLHDLVRLHWPAMDAWFEEDEEVFVHARDPYKRIDVLASSRHVEVEVDGVKLAETTRPLLLFETGLATRYYVPRADLRTDLLDPSDTVTHCPYKGRATYWHVRTGDGEGHDDLVWTYEDPVDESRAIAGYVAFFDERATIRVDGEATR